MKKTFFIFAATFALTSACKKDFEQDYTEYGRIETIYACDSTISYGKKYFPKEDKWILTEEGWPYLLGQLNARGDNLKLDYLDKIKFKVDSLDSSSGLEHTVYTFGSGDYDKIILYLHGGAYVFNAYYQHFLLANEIASGDVRAKVYLPIYPLAPQATWEQTYKFLDSLYALILKEGKPVIIMGDSAGGGLACAYSQYLYKTGRTLPVKRVLLSPWLDVTHANQEAKAIEDRDLMLCIYGLQQCGCLWAGKGFDARDYRVSPLYGTLDDRIPTLIFVGTNEVMLPDCNTLFNKLVANKCPVTMVQCINLWHVYMTSLSLPESTEAIGKIQAFLLER